MKTRAFSTLPSPSMTPPSTLSPSMLSPTVIARKGAHSSTDAIEKSESDATAVEGGDDVIATVIASLRGAIEHIENSCETASLLHLEREAARIRQAAENDALQGQTEALEAQLQALNAEIRDAGELVEYLERQNAELERERDNLRTENDGLKQRIVEVESQHNSVEIGASFNDKLLKQAEILFDLKTEDLAGQIVDAAREILGAGVGIFTDPSAIDAVGIRGLTDLSPRVSYELFEFTQRVRKGKAVVIENEAEHTPTGREIFNLIALPFAAQHPNGGVLLLANKLDGDFTEQDGHLLKLLEQKAIIALENARCYNQREELYSDTMSALSDAIETRDAYTGGHSQSVMQLAVEVGKRLGLEGERLEEVRQVALLHDIGKIGVPDGILLNTGCLNDDEQKIMRTHPAIGCDLVRRMPHLYLVADAILHHHENWDGSGYPAGLAAEKIPLAARIIGAVDAFEAMTSPRLYRQAVSAQEALEEMKRCSGTQFDPQIVDVMETLLQKSQRSNEYISPLADKLARPRTNALKRSQEQSNYFLQVIEQQEQQQEGKAEGQIPLKTPRRKQIM